MDLEEIDLYADVNDFKINSDEEVKETKENLQNNNLNKPSNSNDINDENQSIKDVKLDEKGFPIREQFKKFNQYIGNLTWWTTDTNLKDILINLGIHDLIEIKFSEDKLNGQSKGYAAVTVGSEDSQQKLFSSCQGMLLNGRKLTVAKVNRQTTKALDETAIREGNCRDRTDRNNIQENNYNSSTRTNRNTANIPPLMGNLAPNFPAVNSNAGPGLMTPALNQMMQLLLMQQQQQQNNGNQMMSGVNLSQQLMSQQQQMMGNCGNMFTGQMANNTQNNINNNNAMMMMQNNAGGMYNNRNSNSQMNSNMQRSLMNPSAPYINQSNRQQNDSFGRKSKDYRDDYHRRSRSRERHGSRGKRHYSPSNDSSSRYQRRHRDETFDHSRHSSSRRHVPGPSPVQTHPPQHHHASRANRRRFRRDSTSDSDMDTRNSRLSNKSPPEGYTCGDITPPEIAPPVPPSKDVAMYDTDPDLDKNDLGSSDEFCTTIQEFELLIKRNSEISKTAISRAIHESDEGNHISAIDILQTAMMMIKNSKISKDETSLSIITTIQEAMDDIEWKMASIKTKSKKNENIFENYGQSNF